MQVIVHVRKSLLQMLFLKKLGVWMHRFNDLKN